MIEIEREILIVLFVLSFLAGILITVSVLFAIKLKGISDRMKYLADRLKPKDGGKK